MSKYLIEVTEVYRADTEDEAIQMIEEARQDGRFEVIDSGYKKKNQKQKGEIVDEWCRVSIKKGFDSEKEPMGCTTIDYDTTEKSAF